MDVPRLSYLFKRARPLPTYVGALIQWLWLIVLCAVIAGGAAFTLSKLQHPVYRASALLVVDESESGDVYNAFLASEQFATMYTQLATQQVVLDQAARNLGTVSAKTLSDQISTVGHSGSPVFEIRADAPTPTEAATNANGVAEALVAVVNQQGPGNTNIVHVFQPALPPSAPDHPNAMKNALVGVVLGLALATIFALLIEVLRERVRTAEQIEQTTGLATIGAIPDLNTSDSPAVWRDDAHLRESFRMLRANLYSRPGQTLRLLAITSAEPEEGKSLVATELAITLARSGKRVLLIDCDLHHPSVHERLGIPNTPGLAVYLEDSHLEPQFETLPEFPTLWILPAGEATEHTTEALGSGRMHRLLQHLPEHRQGNGAGIAPSRRAAFAARQGKPQEVPTAQDAPDIPRDADVIVLDTPPLLAFADAAILCAEADGVLVVADTKRSRMSALNEAQQVLGRVGARVLGVVLNRASDKGAREYYRVGTRSRTDTPAVESMSPSAT